MSITNDDLGRVAYDAYARSVGHTTFNGDSMWEWENLPTHIAHAWTTAAIAVKTRVVIEERQQHQLHESETEQ